MASVYWKHILPTPQRNNRGFGLRFGGGLLCPFDLFLPDIHGVSAAMFSQPRRPNEAVWFAAFQRTTHLEGSIEARPLLPLPPFLCATSVAAGWGALHQLWGIGPADFDAAVLLYLYTKSPEQQEQILLTFAAIGIRLLFKSGDPPPPGRWVGPGPDPSG